MGKTFTEGGRCFLILEAIRSAARDFCRNAPKTEEEQWQQELRLQGDQETIWYDPDFIEPLRQLAFSRKWVERFRELEHGGKPSDVLRELRAEIDENGLMCAVLNALNCWADELAKKRNESGLPEYRLEYVKEQMEKMELARKGLCELDEEGSNYRDYIGHLQAVQWLTGVTGEAAPVEQAEEPAAGDGGAATDQNNDFAVKIRSRKGERGLPMRDVEAEFRRIAERDTGNHRRGVKGIVETLVAENESVLREVYPNSKNLVSFIYDKCKGDEKIKKIAEEHSGSKKRRRERSGSDQGA